ncbi:hypothetical protein AB1Y20_023565 [Prymnesium parvum]|uniref:Uncharacterized protein n=1 Tax=Prymnesium parvum TaxID=97485 RepID=A0AB34JGR3_PRYPA
MKAEPPWKARPSKKSTWEAREVIEVGGVKQSLAPAAPPPPPASAKSQWFQAVIRPSRSKAEVEWSAEERAARVGSPAADVLQHPLIGPQGQPMYAHLLLQQRPLAVQQQQLHAQQQLQLQRQLQQQQQAQLQQLQLQQLQMRLQQEEIERLRRQQGGKASAGEGEEPLMPLDEVVRLLSTDAGRTPAQPGARLGAPQQAGTSPVKRTCTGSSASSMDGAANDMAAVSIFDDDGLSVNELLAVHEEGVSPGAHSTWLGELASQLFGSNRASSSQSISTEQTELQSNHEQPGEKRSGPPSKQRIIKRKTNPFVDPILEQLDHLFSCGESRAPEAAGDDCFNNCELCASRRSKSPKSEK